MSRGKWSEEKKKAWSEKCKQTSINNKNKTPQMLEAQGKRLQEFWKDKPWTEDRRKKHSIAMKKAVLENTDSYTKNNVSGRAKIYSCKDFDGNLTKVKGKWELAVANFLNQKEIRWTNSIEPVKYYWNNAWHLYYPDFLLIDFNILLEVKGYKTERDYCKWASVKSKFALIEKQQIKNLDLFFEQLFKKAG